MSFGIGMNSAYTWEEIGQQLSITEERVRQIVIGSLNKLHHPSRRRKLGLNLYYITDIIDIVSPEFLE